MRAPTLVLCGGLALCLSLVQCGGKGSSSPRGEPAEGGQANGGSTGTAGGTTQAGAMQTQCDPPDPGNYEPRWSPPQPTPGACTAEQIQRQFELCQDTTSATYDRDACRAFNAARDNAACVDCLFSAVNATDSHAVLVFPNGYEIANVGGCIALVDGDETESGCGALTQAVGVCEYRACLTSCNNPTPAAWDACLRQAENGSCANFKREASCTFLPKYAQCHWDSWPQYFTNYADLFCGSGPPIRDNTGGAAGAAP